MKITTNMVGNYTPKINTGQVKQARQGDAPVKAEAKPKLQPDKNNITADEKKFFMDLYPQNKSEIIDYHFYRKNGEMSGVKIGSLFDKRG